MSTKNIAVIVLAGGHSSRMNYPKAWLMFNDKETFLESIINSYNQVGINPIVVLNTTFTENQWNPFVATISTKTKLIKNSFPEKGRLYSLFLGLKALKNEDAAFIHNVDQPCIEPEVIKQLINNYEPHGITIPVFKGYNGHPVLIGKTVINEIINHFNEYQTLRDVWKFFPKKRIEVQNKSILININTPIEFEKWKSESLN